MQIPFSTLPHLPFLWSALLLEIGKTGREVIRDAGEYWGIRASPVSMTYRIPGIVMDVSATLVATIIFRPEERKKTFFCSEPESLAYRGRTIAFSRSLLSISSHVSLISCSVGMKTRTSPFGLFLCNFSMVNTAISTWFGSPVSSCCLSEGRYLILIGYIRPETSMIGA